jgi:D-amino-acid oxidase
MAGFTPTAGLVSADRRTPQWDAQFREAAEISYRQLQLLAGAPGYGVYWIDSYTATEDPNPQPPAEGAQGTNPGQDLLPDQLRTGRDREVLGPGEHPFPAKYAVRTSQLSIEPSIYLDALVRDFVFFGGKIVIRKFDTSRDLMSLSESVIVNCTGLGSKTIFNDNELVPVKGQLTVCIPQPEINYRAAGRIPNSGVTASLNPRSDGIILGNMQERGNWSLEPNLDVRKQNVDAAIQFCRAMRPPSERIQYRSSGTPKGMPALESFYGLES